MGSYFNVLRVLGLHEDFLKLAADDEFGRKLQDLALLCKKPKKLTEGNKSECSQDSFN